MVFLFVFFFTNKSTLVLLEKMEEILHRLVCFSGVCPPAQKPSTQCDSDLVHVLVIGITRRGPGCLCMQMAAAANHVSFSESCSSWWGGLILQLSNHVSLDKVLRIKLIAAVSSVQTEQEEQKVRERERRRIPALQGSYGLKKRWTSLPQDQCLPTLISGAFIPLWPWGIDYVRVRLFENRENHISLQFTFVLLALEVRLLTLDFLSVQNGN